MFTITKKDGATRIGILKTAHGETETPFFMPVATKATAKHLNQQQLKETGTEVFISNALILYLTNYEMVKQFGIHRFMNWQSVIFTDSGGFQILRDGFLLDVEEAGVRLKNPFNGSKLLLKPEQAIEIQNNLGADVIMALDDVPNYHKHGTDFEQVKRATERTHRWAATCKKSHDKKGQLLFGICQGGVFPELRTESAKAIAELDFDGIALEGFV